MTTRQDVITHLQIMHTWATFAAEREGWDFLTPAQYEQIMQWTADAGDYLDGADRLHMVFMGAEAHIALAYGLGFKPRHYRDLAEWTMDALEALKWEEEGK